MIAVPAILCPHAMWRRFLWVAFGPKYQPEPSEQALARLYTSDVCVFGGTPNQCLFCARLHRRRRCARARAMASNLLGTRHERSLFSVESTYKRLRLMQCPLQGEQRHVD